MPYVWRIGTDTPDYTSDDLSGIGAEKTGGRWNRKGHPVLYTASSISLAALETLGHLGTGGLPLNRYLVRIEVPDDVWNARERKPALTLPVGWDARPEGMVSLDLGDQWLKELSSVLLEVPSVVVPEENNVLVNPRHPHAGKITATKMRLWQYDQRIR
ncbi:RES family NAD+ phosphorylase [Simplicispira suum]|uniref:RES domain-containing protein n=1 Tax=Simplicispira suum TaxID=2109915 RepID=A0A2S0N611_9BURK|nr:RES family NAD+ phosphorylase [Simplicispira suum]AVO43565.1 hypothetical protein C6571_19280 [Simplicispira suum]